MTLGNSASEARRVLCLGAYILDILGRPISRLPDTQNSQLIEEIRLTVAGTAGGTAVDLARLGIPTSAGGALGDDAAGRFVRTLLDDAGVDTRWLATIAGVQTSCTMLPIAPDGSRPAWHVRGANALFGAEHLPWTELGEFAAVHVGGVNALPGFDGDTCVQLMSAAKQAGCIVTADCLGAKRADAADLLRRYLPYVDVFLPNDLEALKITGADRVSDAAAAFRNMGAGAVVVTTGPDGCVVADSGGVWRIPAYDVPVVDSTGCGDAFSAGVLAGLVSGWDLERCVNYGNAAAALTLQALGSDGGRLSAERVTAALSGPHRSFTDGSPGEQGVQQCRR
ncbi:sugar kinase [Dactylosporangium fulvum]|uniref:carbohydrate kinase family protein n=1 Tax=Dactylosporangium fulvum TaxID=53359 RepID=UPI0031E40238